MGKFTPGRTKVQDIDIGAAGQSNVPVEGTWTSIPRIAKVTYDFAVDGGGVGNKNLSVSIPDNAIIVGGYIDVETDLASDGSATVGVGINGAYTAFKNAAAFTDYTANGSGLILTNVAPPNRGAKVAGGAVPVGIVIGTAALTGGKMHICVTYLAGV